MKERMKMEETRMFKEKWAAGGNGPCMPEDGHKCACEPKSMKDLFNDAFDALTAVRAMFHEASEAEYKSKAFLKEKETDLLMSGAIIGKNAEARSAELAACTKTEIFDVEETRKAKMIAQLRFDLAQMQVDRLKWLVRCDTQEV
jgi:hypothetical protein